MIAISSDTVLDAINQSFKISAGPGAGKTHWLVNHIKNVIHNSDRLYKTKKVGCITYTNTAVETIKKRLDTSSNSISVTTIHSFLYQNILKPYIAFIPEEYELNIYNVKGHEEIITSTKKIISWLESHPEKSKLSHPFTLKQLTKLPDNKNALINWLESLSCKIDSKGMIDYMADDKKAVVYSSGQRRGINRTCLNILKKDLLQYKKQYWKDGKLSHDDVLFFSYILLMKYPYIGNIIAEKFPYLFFDEFQDTSPIQVEILKKLCGQDIVIGIIGDLAQSIYGFQGADPSQFRDFKIKDMAEYILNENRRSSSEIITLLNKIRTGITQNDIRQVSIRNPKVIVGSPIYALNKAREILSTENVTTLARDNITSNILKNEFDKGAIDKKLLNTFNVTDSNYIRHNTVLTGIKVLAFTSTGKIKDAINVLENHLFFIQDKAIRRKTAVNSLYLIYSKYKSKTNKTLLEFTSFLRDEINNKISGFKAGKVKDFYEKHTVKELMICINIPEDQTQHITIHKSKGNEFDNVLLVLKRISDLNFIFKTDLNNNEEHRINYVGISRARDNLFINVPEINDTIKTKLNDYIDDIEIEL